MEDDQRPTIPDGPVSPSDDLRRDEGELIGCDVGGYVIECELGRGGMGVVYAATHPVIGKRAAIKVLKRSMADNPATVERFVQEARSVNQIGHPSIVDIFAFGTLPDGRSYLVMDLLDGESLRKRVRRGPVPVQEAAPILDEIASALAAAHDKGFIHRDLKPDNVFLVAHPGRVDVKLLDFGLAKLRPNATLARAFRTATGAQIGTPDYMSPEQLRGTGVDHRTDLYALGVLAFELLTGERPCRYGDGSFELDGATVAETLARVPSIPGDIPDLVEALLAPKPDDRPSLVAVRAVLKRCRPSLQSIEPVPPPVRAIGTEPMLDTFSPSMLGARPILPTPPAGSPTVKAGRPDRVSQPPATMPAPVSQPPASPQTPSQSGQAFRFNPGAGLRTSGQHPSTKLGVAPPPERSSRPHPVQSQRLAAQGTGESRVWLVVALALVVIAGLALVFVLAS